jgi:flagellar hook-associated protein 2
MPISSAGLGSGLDVNSIVSQLMAVERKPVNSLNTKEVSFQAKLSTFGSIKSSMAALQTAAKALSTPAQLSPTKASVANTAVMNVTTAGNAAAGSYDIEVVSLAQSQKLITATGYAASTSTVGTGVITLDFGAYDTATPPAFTANAGKTSKTITIDSTNNTLAGIRDAINASSSGVTASIINNGTSNFLSLTSTDTGASNAMKISVSDSSLNALVYNGSTNSGNMAQTVGAKDAVIKVDTVTITKPSNVITDAIEGVTLNLTGTTATGATTKLAVTRDTASVATAIQNFVKAYNDTSALLASSSAYDAATGTAAVLSGDSTVRSIQTQLRGLLGTPIPGAPEGSSLLAQIGVTSQRDGTLAVDATKLTAALADNTKNFQSLFATNGENKGYGAQMDNLIGRLLSPVGLLPTHTNSITTSITALSKQRDVINARLVNVEKRYRAQFTALDTAIASMTTTSNFLTQQLAAIAKNG